MPARGMAWRGWNQGARRATAGLLVGMGSAPGSHRREVPGLRAARPFPRVAAGGGVQCAPPAMTSLARLALPSNPLSVIAPGLSFLASPAGPAEAS
jgi:hypothetical protein